MSASRTFAWGSLLVVAALGSTCGRAGIDRRVSDVDAGGAGIASMAGDGRSASRSWEPRALALEERSCAIGANGAVRCWGNNVAGVLGIGDLENRGDDPGEMGSALPGVDLGAGHTAKALALGRFFFSCAILDDDGVKCWGAPNGMLVTGMQRIVAPAEAGEIDFGPGRTARAIAAGREHVCVILDNGLVKCWGQGAGLGKPGLSSTPGLDGDGAVPASAVASMPPIGFGDGRTAKAIAALYDHNCVILDDGSVKCWGQNYTGQLGQGDLSGRSWNQVGGMPPVNLGTNRRAKAIGAGLGHTCAILDDDSVKCWGSALFLGQGDGETRGDDPNEMGDALPVVNLGAGRSAKAIAVAAFHTCAILDNDLVKCWGGRPDFDPTAPGNSSRDAQGLGLGDLRARGFEPNEMGDALPYVDLGTGRTARSIAAGEHTCVILDDGTVKCWGQNIAGELGQGDLRTRGDHPGEMGDALAPIPLAF